MEKIVALQKGYSVSIFVALYFFDKKAEENEYEDLLNEYFVEFLNEPRDTKTIVIHDIISSDEMWSDNCRERKDTENCYLLKFVSDSEYTQSFVAFENEVYAYNNGDITLEIVDFTKEELAFIYEYQQYNGKVSKESFSIGKTLIIE